MSKKIKDKQEMDNENYNQYFYIANNNVKRKAEGFHNNNPSSSELKDLSNNILNVVGDYLIDKNYSHTQELSCDTISVSKTDNNNLVISGNVKERRVPKTSDQTVTVKDRKHGKYEYTSERFGIDNELGKTILKEVKRDPLYKNSDLNVKIIEKERKSRFNDLHLIEKMKNNAESHAEMKTLKYCDESKQKVEKIGISKPACKSCHSELKNRDIQHEPKGAGNKTVRNWKNKEEIKENVKVIKQTKRQENVECNFSMGSNNIKFSKKAVKSNLKDNVKNCYKPGGSVGLISGTIETVNTLKNGNVDPHSNADVLSAKSGTCRGKLGIGETAYASASVLECKAGYGNVAGVGASALSASAYAEYGLENSVGADLNVVRGQANIGPVQVGVGLSFDTHATIGVNGFGASFFGTGFHIGPKMEIRIPFFDFSVNLF